MPIPTIHIAAVEQSVDEEHTQWMDAAVFQ